eukprot:1907795-Rhodomonas_salina.3
MKCRYNFLPTALLRRVRYCHCGTDVAIGIRACYAMSGTDLAYGPGTDRSRETKHWYLPPYCPTHSLGCVQY